VSATCGFNRRFAKPAAEKGTAFRKSARKDLDCVFSIQTERTVAHDNTIVLQNRNLQLTKTRFRNTLAGCTVTVCEHLDGRLSVRWGPHLLTVIKAERDGGKDGSMQAGENQNQVSSGFHTPLEISHKPRDSHFAHRPTTATRRLKSKAKTQAV
jgi:hypothetical protein